MHTSIQRINKTQEMEPESFRNEDAFMPSESRRRPVRRPATPHDFVQKEADNIFASIDNPLELNDEIISCLEDDKR